VEGGAPPLEPAGDSAPSRMEYFFPFINQNVTFDNIRLVEEFGGPEIDTFSIGRYLPPLLARVSLSEAIDQSKTD
jgi:hypothetical protein